MFDKQPTNDVELHDLLNKQFYAEYDTDYFLDKAIINAGMIAKPLEYIRILSAGYEVGKIKIGELDEVDARSFSKNAKRELVVNSYHGIETFFRLLFACVEYPKCTWLGLVELNDFAAFKKRVNQISAHTYFKDDQSEVLAELLLGPREGIPDLDDGGWEKNKRVIQDLVDRIAHDLLSTPDYNVYKHGVALFDTEFGFSLGDIIKMDKQEAFIFLSKAQKKTETEIIETYSKNYKFMKWEIRFATTYLTGHLISNLVNLSSVRLGVKKSASIKPFHHYDLHQILETGIITDTIGELLVERHYARKKKN